MDGNKLNAARENLETVGERTGKQDIANQLSQIAEALQTVGNWEDEKGDRLDKITDQLGEIEAAVESELRSDVAASRETIRSYRIKRHGR